MTNPVVNVFYIGTLPILDSVQGNGTMEDASSLLGLYQVGTDAIYHTMQAQHDPLVVDGLLATNDYGASASYPDGYYNEGFTNTVSGGFSEVDSQQLFLGTVSYRDIDGTVKTMQNVPFNVYQLENGDTYIAPTTEIASPTSGLASDGGEFIASVLSGRDIVSVELTTLRNDAIGQDSLLYDYESVQDQVQTFYLGNQSILDTTQGNGVMEGAGSLLGGYDATVGTPGDGQFTLHTLHTRHDPAVNDGLLATNDYGASASYPDGYYDEGFSNAPTAGQNGTTFSELDSQQLFWGDVYYIDANGNQQVMHNVALNVYQLENGDIFAVPTREIVSQDGTYSDASDSTLSVLAGLTISRIELTSLRNDLIGQDSLLYDSESIGDGLTGANLPPPDGVVDGTPGNDAMTPGYSDTQGDQIDGADGNADLIYAYGGNDTVDAGAGNDTLFGGTGDDSLTGGAGNDRLYGGAGANTLTGGDGDDTFIWEGVSTTIVTDWQTGATGSLTDGNAANNDFLDLSTWYNTTTLTAVNGAGGNFGNALAMLRADAADGVIDGIIGGVDYSALLGLTGSLELQGADASSTGNLTAETVNVVCFVRGTRIKTIKGEVAIENLSEGDLILTLDNGYRPLRWIGSTTVAGKGKLAPIWIAAGALGNTRDLWVSPQHRMCLRHWRSELLFGERETLAAAKHLVNGATIRQIECDRVDYFHILFDAHEIIFAEGATTESFHPGSQGLGALSEETRAEVLDLFPNLQVEGPAAYGPTARLSLKAHEAAIYMQLCTTGLAA